MRFDGGRLLSRLGLILGDFLDVKSQSLRREFRLGPPGARFPFLNDALFPVCLLFSRVVFLVSVFFGGTLFSEISVFRSQSFWRDGLFSINSPALLQGFGSGGLADSGRRSSRLFSPHERLGHEFSCY